MSHISTVKTTLTDAHYIERALVALGYAPSVSPGQKFITQFGDVATVDIAFQYKLDKPYREPELHFVGFAQSETGEYELVGDFWNWESKKDALLASVIQQYGAQMAIDQLAAMGFTETYSEIDGDGNLRLIFNR